MTKLDINAPFGKKVGTIDLPDQIFSISDEVVNNRKALLHQVVVAQLAALRRGTHKAKTRSEVSGGGIKPYKQKGTGRARQGSIRAPQFAGGGIVHGPVNRNYSQRTPKRMKKTALFTSLSDRNNAKHLFILHSIDTEKISTKFAALMIENFVNEKGKKVLFVLSSENKNLELSLKNISDVSITRSDYLTTYDVLVNDYVIFTDKAIKEFLLHFDKTFDEKEIVKVNSTALKEAEKIVADKFQEILKMRKARDEEHEKLAKEGEEDKKKKATKKDSVSSDKKPSAKKVTKKDDADKKEKGGAK